MSWYCSYFGLFPSFTIWEENKRCRAFSFVPVNFTRRHKPAASTNSRNWLRAFFFNFFGGNEHSLENKINVFFLEDCLIKPCMCMCSFLKILFCFVFVLLLNIWLWPRQGIWEMSPSTNICSSTETFPKHLPKAQRTRELPTKVTFYVISQVLTQKYWSNLIFIISTKHQLQNLNQTSAFRLNLSIKIFTKPSFKISTSRPKLYFIREPFIYVLAEFVR